MSEVLGKSDKTTLTSLLQSMVEIEEILEGTTSKLEFACDESEPVSSDRADNSPTVSLNILQTRLSNIRRHANKHAKLTTNLLGN